MQFSKTENYRVYNDSTVSLYQNENKIICLAVVLFRTIYLKYI